MEGQVNTPEIPQSIPTPTSPTSNSEPSFTMEGGGVSDSGQKLGWIPIMMLGLASASLIYSIFYYRRRLDALKKGENKIVSQLQSDMSEMQDKIDTLMGKRIKNARLV